MEPQATPATVGAFSRSQRLDSALQSIPAEQQKQVRDAYQSRAFDADSSKLKGLLDSLPADNATRGELWDTYWQYEAPKPAELPKPPAPQGIDINHGLLGKAIDLAAGVGHAIANPAVPRTDFDRAGPSTQISELPKVPSSSPAPAKATPKPKPQQQMAQYTTGRFTGLPKPQAQAYQTQLTPDEHREYAQWVRDKHIPVDLSDQNPDYDMQGFWKAMKENDPRATQNNDTGHFPDTWKTPHHESFSNESIYAGPGAPRWNDKDQLVDSHGNVVYTEGYGKPKGGPGTSSDPSVLDIAKRLPGNIWKAVAEEAAGALGAVADQPYDVMRGLPPGAKPEVTGGAAGTIAKGAGGLLKGASLQYYDPEKGTLQVPVMGDKVQIHQPLSEVLEKDWGVPSDIAHDGTAASIGNFFGLTAPWSKISQALHYGVLASGATALMKAEQSGVPQQVTKTVGEIAKDILKRAGFQGTVGAIYGTIEAQPENEGIGDRAKRVGETALYGAGFSLAVDGLLSVLTGEVTEAVRVEALNKFKTNLADTFYRTGRFKTPQEAAAAADAVGYQAIKANSGRMPTAETSRNAIQALKDWVSSKAKVTAEPAVEPSSPEMPEVPEVPSTEVTKPIEPEVLSPDTPVPDATRTAPAVTGAGPDEIIRPLEKQEPDDRGQVGPAPPNERWSADRGAIPGEPILYLDVPDEGDLQDSPGAIYEEDQTHGQVLYKGTIFKDGKHVEFGPMGDVHQLAAAMERYHDTSSVDIPKPLAGPPQRAELPAVPGTSAAPEVPKAAAPTIPQPKKQFKLEPKPGAAGIAVKGIAGDQVVLEDGTKITPKLGERYIKTLRQFGYTDLSEEQVQSLASPTAVAALPEGVTYIGKQEGFGSRPAVDLYNLKIDGGEATFAVRPDQDVAVQAEKKRQEFAGSKPQGTVELMPPAEHEDGLGDRWHADHDLGSMEEGEAQYWLDGTDAEDAKAGIKEVRTADGMKYRVETPEGTHNVLYDTVQEAAAAAEKGFPQEDAVARGPKKLPEELPDRRELRTIPSGEYTGKWTIVKPGLWQNQGGRRASTKELDRAHDKLTDPKTGDYLVPPAVAGPAQTPKAGIPDNIVDMDVRAKTQAEAMAKAVEELRRAGENPDDWQMDTHIISKGGITPTRGADGRVQYLPDAEPTYSITFNRKPKAELPAVPSASKFSVQPVGGQFHVVRPNGQPLRTGPVDTREEAQRIADGMQADLDKMLGTDKKPETAPKLQKPPTPGAKPVSKPAKGPSSADVLKKAFSEKPPSTSALEEMKRKMQKPGISEMSSDQPGDTNALVRQNLETSPLAGNYPVFNYDVSVPDAVRDELAMHSSLAVASDAIGDAFYSLRRTLAAANRGLGSPTFAISLKGSHLGAHLDGELLGLRHNLIVINPYTIIGEINEEIRTGVLDPAAASRAAAKRIVLTIIHEFAHSKHRGHDAAHTGLFGRLVDSFLDEILEASKAIQAKLETGDNHVYDELSKDQQTLDDYWRAGGTVPRDVGSGSTREAQRRIGQGNAIPRAIEGPGRGEDLQGRSGGTSEMVAGSPEPGRSSASIVDLSDTARAELLKVGVFQYRATPDYDDWVREMGTIGDWVQPYLASAYDLIDSYAEASGMKPVEAPKAELPKVPETQAGPRGPPDEVPGLVQRYQPLVDRLFGLFKNGESINNARLRDIANEAFGGTRGQGNYNIKESYDAAETAINKVLEQPGIIDFNDIPGTLKRIGELEARIPRQTDRTTEGIELQQFSTPPAEGLGVIIASGLKPGMVGMEPSAGAGGMAIIGRLTGATIVTNEIDPKRRAMLKILGFDPTSVDAQYLNNLLPFNIEPDVFFMNPPFSSTGGRTAGHNTKYGAEHVTQALARVKNGGRVVAIVGRGMAHGRPGFDAWWEQIEQRYNVRANIGIDRKYYGKYGTGFDNQILVIDKTGPTPGTTRADKLLSITRADDLSPEQAIELLKNLGEEDVRGRIERLSQATKPAGASPAREPVRGSASSGSGKVSAPRVGGGGGQGGRLPAPPRPGTESPALGPVDTTIPRPPEPGTSSSDATGELAGTGAAAGPATVGQPGDHADAGRTGGGRDSLTLDKENTAVGEAETEVHSKYVIQKARFKGSVPHPANIVESAILASVTPPDVTYKPSLPEDVIKEGRISDVQLEAVTYAGQRHEQMLPGGRKRAGFQIGDGTGLGKGREAAAIIYDNFLQGRKKAAWFSLSHQLRVDAQRDLDGVGVPMKIIAQQDFKGSDTIPAKEGVLFTTYGLAAQKYDSDKQRFKQIADWLGKDYDGVIIFDESHAMKNSITTGIGGQADADAGTLVGKMAMGLDELLPNARIVYVSATAATVPRNMGYMGRLGMWGPGSPFPDFMDFLSAIGSGGVGAMEMLARDLKATGSYVSRLISYKGIEYGKVTHKLTPEEIGQYNRMADLWLGLQKDFEAAAVNAGQGSARAKAARLSAFYSTQQRFFLQVMMGYQLPDLFAAAQADLDAGRSVVISLYNTNEGQVKRKVAEAEAAGEDLDELDLTPRELIADLIRKSFPVNQYTTVKNPVTGKDESVLMKDENDNPVQNRENLLKREQLLDSLSEVRVPDNALDAIVNHFGAKNLSEVSGRSKRLEGNQYVRRKIKDVPIKQRDATEVKRFQDGDVRVIVITGKASAGISLHSDKTAKNKQRRVFYAMQLSWSADKQMQSFGRVHRSSQEEAPIIKLVQTDLRGQERLTNTVASRLASLGAITEGSRESKGGELFAAMDITDQYGEAALIQMWRDAINNKVPGIVSGPQLLTRMGVIDNDGGIKSTDLTNVDRFLNRILGLQVNEQNSMFEHFFTLYQAGVANAKEHGTFDTGVEKIDADDITLVSKEEIHKHSSGAKTELIELTGNFKLHPMPWVDVVSMIADQDALGFVTNKKSGKLYFGKTRTSMADGVEVHLYSPKSHYSDHTVTLNEWRDKFDSVKAENAMKPWDKTYTDLPKFETRPINLISGAVFPIYDKIFEGSTYGHKVVRAIAADGTPYIGIRMKAQEIPNLKHRLGIGTPLAQATASDIYKMVENRSTIELDNGWEIKLTYVHGETRMELDPKGRFHHEEMTDAGLLGETIDYKKRFFIPLDPESGPEILGNVLALHKAVRDKTAGTAPAPRPTSAPRQKKPKISTGTPPAVTPPTDDSGVIPRAVTGPFRGSGRSAQLPPAPQLPVTINGTTYESDYIQVWQQDRGFKEVAGWKIAPGLAVTPSLADDGKFVVTHITSGKKITDGDSTAIAISKASRLASLGDWTRSADDITSDKDFVAGVNRVLKGEAGALNFWRSKAPPKIPQPQLLTGHQDIDPLFDKPNTARNLWQDLREFPGKVYKLATPLIYNADIKMWPIFAERVRRTQGLASDAATKTVARITEVLKGLDPSEYDLFARIIYLEDLYETAITRGVNNTPLASSTATNIVNDLDNAIIQLRANATPAVLDSIDRHHTWMEEVYDDLVARGKTEAGMGRVKYFPNYIRRFGDGLDALPGLPYSMREPKRQYLRKRRGHTQIHDSNYIGVMEQYGTRVNLHNAIDDFQKATGQEYDIRNGTNPELPKLTQAELMAVLSQFPTVQPGNTYDVKGIPFKAYQFNPGRVLYPVRVVDGYVIQDAINAGLDELGIDIQGLAQTLQARMGGMPGIPSLTTPFPNLETVMGEQLTSPALALGQQHQMFIVPAEVANKLERFRESNQPNIISEIARIETKVFKMLALHFNPITWQRQNILSNNVMLAAESLTALGKQPEALQLLRGKLTGPHYDLLLELINDARIYSSSFIGTGVGSTRAINHPDLRQYRSQSTSTLGKLNPFGDNPIGDFWRAYQSKLHTIEAIPKVALFLENYDNLTHGIPVKPITVSLGGLAPGTVLAVGRSARELNGDFAAVTDKMKIIQGFGFPFAIWYMKISPQVLRGLGHINASWGVKAMLALLIAIQIWNHVLYPETEDAMDWQKEFLHINTPFKDEHGNPYYWSLQTPLDGAGQWVGLDKVQGNLDEVLANRMTLEEAAGKQLNDMFGFQKDSAMPFMTAAGSLLGKLLNPAVKAFADLRANRDSFTGQEIVSKSNPNLWGTLSHMTPDNPEGQKIQRAYFLKQMIAPYAQYLRASQMKDPDSTIWNWITDGPASWRNVLGIKAVNMDGLNRERWYDAKNFTQSLHDMKMVQIIGLQHAKDSGDLSADDYAAAAAVVGAGEGPVPTDAEIDAARKTPAYQIVSEQEALKKETDPAKRRVIEDHVKYLQLLRSQDNYKNEPAWMKRTIGPPPTPHSLQLPAVPQ